MQVFGNLLQDVGLSNFSSRMGWQNSTHLLETHFIFNSILVESFITNEILPCLAYFSTVSKTLGAQRIQDLFPQMRKPSQGLLYRWTEHSILPIPLGGDWLDSNNATQTHTIFVKL